MIASREGRSVYAYITCTFYVNNYVLIHDVHCTCTSDTLYETIILVIIIMLMACERSVYLFRASPEWKQEIMLKHMCMNDLTHAIFFLYL